MQQRNFPQNFRGQTPLDELGNRMRRKPFPDSIGTTLDGTPAISTPDGGGGGGYCDFDGSGRIGGNAHVVFYRFPDSILFQQTVYSPRLSSLFSCYYII